MHLGWCYEPVTPELEVKAGKQSSLAEVNEHRCALSGAL